MDYGFGTEGYYKKMLELQERLRKSEEEKLKLEEKFNEMMQHSRDTEHDRLRLMRHRYHKFLEEDKIRQERNENILRTLDKIESRANTLAAKTNRFKAFRKQYESYIKRIYRMKNEQHTPSPQPDRHFSQSNIRRKLFSDLPENDETVEGKLAMLEQYLRDNFENFPREPTTKQIKENEQTPNLVHKPQKSFFNLYTNDFQRPQYFDPPDSDSKESQELNEECNKYPMTQFNGKTIPEQHKFAMKSDETRLGNVEEPRSLAQPTKSELLGNTIEKELERLKTKQVSLQKENSFEVKPEQVIQDYKELVSKSEEKYGLRGNSPAQHKSIPKIFDNTTKTLNIKELKNIGNTEDKSNTKKDVTNSNNILQVNTDSESESPVIKNYKNMVKSLQEDIPPIENNNLNVNVKMKSPDSNNSQENNLNERLKQEDNSERTEPPTDVSLNLSSNRSEESFSKDQIKIENPINSLDESTIKEQLYSNPEKEQNKLLSNGDGEKRTISQNVHEEKYQRNPQEEQPVYEEQNIPEVENQAVYPEEPVYQEGYEEQPIYQEGYDLSQQNISDPVYQAGYDATEQNLSHQQPEYQEGYDMSQKNIPNELSEYQEGYGMAQPNMAQQPEYQEGYEAVQQNVNDQQPQYQNGYEAAQQNITEQQAQYQEGYEDAQQNITEQQPQYQDGYEGAQQNITEQQPQYQDGYEGAQQNVTKQQPQYQDGYEGAQQNITEQQPQYQEGYEAAQQNTTQPEYQEGYDTSQQNIPDQQPQYQEGYEAVQQNTTQPEYQEGYDMSQQNITEQQPQYQDGYEAVQQNITDQQPQYQEGYEGAQQNIPDQQPQYQEGYEAVQQNTTQPEYQEGYDMSQQNVPDPNYQEGYDSQYYTQQQNEPGQEIYDTQQYAEGQPMYQEYPSEQPQESYGQDYADHGYQPQGYLDQQYPQGQAEESVYRSEHEYLQGEQNLDKDYENEQSHLQPQEGYSRQEIQGQQKEIKRGGEQGNSVNPSESTEKSSSLNDFVDNKPLVEKKMPNLADMLDTDTESVKQDTKASNESDFDFSKS